MQYYKELNNMVDNVILENFEKGKYGEMKLDLDKIDEHDKLSIALMLAERFGDSSASEWVSENKYSTDIMDSIHGYVKYPTRENKDFLHRLCVRSILSYYEDLMQDLFEERMSVIEQDMRNRQGYTRARDMQHGDVVDLRM